MARTFKKLGNIFGKISFELIPVIIGILAALLINDYRESLAERKRREVLLQNLMNEFSDRRDELDSIIIKRHFPLLDTLRAYSDNSDISLQEVLYKAGGIGEPEVYVTSWESALNSQDVRNLDFEFLTLLSKISSSQRFIQTRIEATSRFVYSPELVLHDTRSTVKKQMYTIIDDFVAGELDLIDRYDEYIAVVDSLQGKPVHPTDSLKVDSLKLE